MFNPSLKIVRWVMRRAGQKKKTGPFGPVLERSGCRD